MTRADGSHLVRGEREPRKPPPRNSWNGSRKHWRSPEPFATQSRSQTSPVFKRPALTQHSPRLDGQMSRGQGDGHLLQQLHLPQEPSSDPYAGEPPSNHPFAAALRASYNSPSTDQSPGTQSFTSRQSITATTYEGVVVIEPVADPQKCKYVGKTSTQVLAKSADQYSKPEGFFLKVMDFFCPLLSHSEEVDTMHRPKHQPLVDKATGLRCIDAFFSSIHRILPFLDELHVRKMVDDFYDHGIVHEQVNVCCIYLLIAIGARSFSGSDAEQISTTHFAASWSMHDIILAAPYLASVQCLILMTIELTNQNKEGQAIFAIGTAVRIAQSLGLHRPLSAHKEIIELRFVQKNYRLRSCVWWTCYCLDKKLCFECGRPSIINDTDCDVESISLEDDGNVTETSEAAVFPYLIQICRILSTIMSRLYGRMAESNDELSLLRQIEAIDKMLTDWRSSLPTIWTADPDLMGAEVDSHSRDSVLLYCIYYNALLVIHRAALFGKLPTIAKDYHNGRIASSDVVCLNSSRSLAKYVNVLVNHRENWALLRWITPYCLNVIFTLYMGVVRDPTHWMVDADVGLMRSITRCFSASCAHKVAIRPFDELFRTLEEAMQTLRARKRHAPLSTAATAASLSENRDLTSPGGLEVTGGGLQQMSGPDAAVNDLDGGILRNSTGLNFDTDFQFQDFFDFGVGGEGSSVFQLWPLSSVDQSG
ncbi:hypothetical protein PV08_02505 [Exophiala spinifera]|uniref:Xylanolytic transcriptional activator regulatory domain-containing protein n=1 Tax=Exophiala spinifera TaxID=91928 RepID=A0A0D1ZZQ6_9EURO|nr:uncharacterized protein PV08_02505 [Exophiala spinifera]KIW18217.1 hypothetical protein PV08_02505 [Exophiala spinifera]